MHRCDGCLLVIQLCYPAMNHVADLVVSRWDTILLDLRILVPLHQEPAVISVNRCVSCRLLQGFSGHGNSSLLLSTHSLSDTIVPRNKVERVTVQLLHEWPSAYPALNYSCGHQMWFWYLGGLLRRTLRW